MQCGTLHHDEDEHICNPDDVPKKNEIKRKGKDVFEAVLIAKK